MAAVPRESSFMPTVKCSTCGFQVEISLMGEHICAGAPASERMVPAGSDELDFELTISPAMPAVPAPSLLDRFNLFGAPSTDKQTRMPPQVDTSAASTRHVLPVPHNDTADEYSDRSYLGQGQLTPVSFSSGSRSVSPKTPNARPGLGRSDDYFAPQIANDSPPPQQSRRPGGYGGFGEEPMSSASSPKKQAPNLLERMNSIAPGPFDSDRRPSMTGRKLSGNDVPGERPGTSSSNLSSSLNSNSGGTKTPIAPRKNGYGGFGPPQRALTIETFGLPSRSETFPRLKDNIEPPMRSPSAPGPRPDRRRGQSNASQDMEDGASEISRKPSTGPDTSRMPPPRTSIVRPRTAGRDGPAPGVPAINFAQEFGVGNPYHVSSESTSSSASGYSPTDRRPSQASQASSRTSPPRSLPSRSGRKASDTPGFDSLVSDNQSTASEMNQNAPPPVLQASKDPRFRPSPLLNRPPPPEQGYDPRIYSARPRRARSPLPSPVVDTLSRNNSPGQDGGRSAPDTSFQGAPGTQESGRPVGAIPFRKNSANQDAERPTTNIPAQEAPANQDRGRKPSTAPTAPSPTLLTASPERTGDQSITAPQEPVRRRSPSQVREPAVPSTRGDCKACGSPITGKSISSADGRLTGRYHKACFVCSSCKEAFSSSTFYVIDDQPFCQRHYHELNRSLCGSCDNGIEGQYLEDESAKKHHVGCFRCGDCGMVLSNGYFEVNGKAYCEKDAWRRMQQPWPMNGGPRKGSTASNLGPRGAPGAPRGGAFPPPNGNRLGPLASVLEWRNV
ncbi:hypothetical protein B0T19DRAFT_188684 [Cercophora scortea]|uniref:LIM zinc-binding domain-containing protein n=1 Tax=Cercophora scortea TaxID=314031 RepID=A0AAE0INF4_9PEZI|nr:hypothetical protein B0T19DRAFT_188684 [Cercophora scortea]